ncbi:cytidine and dCMP deaminase domain-containing protein 1-like [Montipora foliosa]|uniref:cytidine and dCMP deaminase domain-containing protein 1-like n=1 Tax=Montipora foliosa TaxID=591990 RepID=UPI0035F115BF
MAYQDPQSTESDQKGKDSTSYAFSHSRLTKDNLYMILALWMEDFPEDKPEEKKPEKNTGETPERNNPYKKVGAVLVLPNDRSYAVDCSRNGVHAVARLLMMHHDVLEDCKVFVSRKPCSFCTKLLVQSKVKRVFYLPIEPEYRLLKDFEQETSRVDNLFKVSSISQSVFVPKVGEDVIKYIQNKHQTPVKKTIFFEMVDSLKKRYWMDDWMKEAKDKLPWQALDEEMRSQVELDFTEMVTWMASILVGKEKEFNFDFELTDSERKDESFAFDPRDGIGKEQSYRLITLAKFLAERTDEPKTGVGAVIINKKKEIVGLGWNGFPSKALYGEFPRASDKDKDVPDKKYPYSIHAEQNALLMRNTKKIKGGILFLTKTPCDDCTPLLEMMGIDTVILGAEFIKKETKKGISYNNFSDAVERRKFACFSPVVSKSETSGAKRNLDREFEDQGRKRERKDC